MKQGERRRVWIKAVSILSCLVVFVTTYMLLLPAITMEKTAVCGIEAHQHDESCWETETKLTCGSKEEDGHRHTDDCFTTTRKLICTLEQHTHSELCFKNNKKGQPSCALEEHSHTGECFREDRLLSCPLEETDDHRHTEDCYEYEKILTCGKEVHTHTAECFGEEDGPGLSLGEEEEALDAELGGTEENTEEHMQISGSEDLPEESVLEDAVDEKDDAADSYDSGTDSEENLSEENALEDAVDEKDNAADSYDSGTDIGEDLPEENVLEDVADEKDDAADGYDSGTDIGEDLSEENVLDDVADEKDDVADGYDSETGSGEDLTDETTQETDQEDPQENAQEDSQDNNQENDHEDPVEPATADETSSGENETLDAETTPGFSGVLTYEGPDYTVTASFDETAGIPSGASLSVEEITQNQDIYQKYSEQAEKAVGEETDGKVAWVRLFDISIVKDGKTIEPTGPVSVQINYHEAMERPKNAEVKAVHFEGEEEIPVVLDTRAKGEETSVEQVSFDTESFSVFAIVGTTIEKTVLASDGNNYKVTVTYGEDAGIPENAELDVKELQEEDYEDYLGRTAVAMGVAGFAYARILDISIVDKEDPDLHYQPEAYVEVKIELVDAAEKGSDPFAVVHFDEKEETGEAEILEAVTVGNSVTFSTDGFSAYAIVTGPDPLSIEWHKVQTIGDLEGKEIYIGHDSGYYFTNKITQINSNRTGITKTKPATATPAGDAIPYYFEPYGESGDQFKVYCFDGDTKKYIVQPTGRDNSLNFTTDESGAAVFTVETVDSENRFRVKGRNNYYWNMQGGANGASFAAYNSPNDVNAMLFFWYHDIFESDPYGLDGKTCGLMNWNGDAAGKAMMAESSGNSLTAKMLTTMVRFDDGEDKLFVPNDSDISMWTFHWIADNKYYLTADTGGGSLYLKIDGTGLSLVSEESEASQIQVVPGTGIHKGQISLKSGNTALTYSGDIETGFSTGGSTGSEWLYMVDLSELTSEYIMAYSATKVSVSDTERLTDGEKIVVYTRIWNQEKTRYEFYAIDSDGTLVPCYENGDSIEWVSGQLNTLLWQFTDYKDEQGNSTNYYELYNEYSGKYLAPQVTGGQILSDDPIGINLNGRRSGKYYSTILAWDDANYAYAGLKVSDIVNGQGTIASCLKGEAVDFYFAVMEDIAIDDELHTVATLDNEAHGITMKIKNFATRTEMSSFLGNNDGGLGTTLHQGLLSSGLGEDGYPTTAGGSLAQLYEGAYEVNHLFIDSTYRASGYFEFDSAQNYATLLGRDGTLGTDFTVYRELGSYDSGGDKPSLKHGQFFPFNDLEPGFFTSVNKENLYSALGQILPDGEPRKHEHLYLIRNPDCYFGVELEAGFVQTPNGLDAWGHDIIYEFTGDDDFWLYVDGELVIDLGGIHSAVQGTVNFRTGSVIVNGVPTTLRSIFRNHFIEKYKKDHEGAAPTETAIEDYLNGIFEGDVFKSNTTHTMKIFYMERGAGASNLHMRFNLASIRPGTVLLSKELSGVDAPETVLAEFPYQILYKYEGDDTEYLLKNPMPEDARNYVFYKDTVNPVTFRNEITLGGQSYQNVFLLKPGETAEIGFPVKALPGEEKRISEYRIIECGVNTDVYRAVSVNDDGITGSPVEGHPNRRDFGIEYETTNERPRVAYRNEVNPDALKTLTITKKLYDETGSHEAAHEIRNSAAAFSLRLYLATEFDGHLYETPANMHAYYVRDPEGNYCIWNADLQGFESTGSSDFDDVPNQEAITFYTSINGAISRIPAFYTVEVRNVLAGTLYRVEERSQEIPDGYSFQEYGNYDNSDGSTQYADVQNRTEGQDTVPGVDGTVIAQNDPNVDVCNLKGWGLRVNKVWSDADFMEEREPTYFAVFIQHNNPQGNGNGHVTLVDGTVRQLQYGDDPQTLYWYFDHLQDNVSFDKYIIREVWLNGSWTVDDNGVVTLNHDNVHPYHEGEHFDLDGRQKGETQQSSFDYTVMYTKGNLSADSNVRVDTVTNSRPGIVLKKQDWNGGALSDAVFELRDDSGSLIGTFTSNQEGLITTAFLSTGKEYTLTETMTPKEYYGLENPLTITLTSSSVQVSGSGSEWYELVQAHGKNMAVLTIKDRPRTFQAVKKDGDTQRPLENFHFQLHKQVTVDGVTAIDLYPMQGYEDLETDASGIIPGLDGTLPAGTYELREKLTDGLPTDHPEYRPLAEYIRFTVSPTGAVSLGTHPDGVTLTGEATASDGTFAYTMTILNYLDTGSQVTIRKTDDSGRTLTGARFQLYKYGSTWEKTDPYTDELDLTQTPEITLEDLGEGRYKLDETLAPDGYVILTRSIYFNILHDNSIVLTDETGEGTNPDDKASIEETEDGYVITVKNTPGASLPATGGPGKRLFTIPGLLLIAGAGFLLWGSRKAILHD